MSETREEPTESVLVTDVPEQSRFDISLDGVQVGFAEYVDAAAEGVVERTFTHTEIDEAYGGRGLATLLIRTALDSSRAKNLPVIAQCPAVRRFIVKHPDYLDLVAAQHRDELGL